MVGKRERSIIALVALVVLVGTAFTYFRTPKLERRGAIDQLLPSVVRIITHAVVNDDSPGAPSKTKVQESFGSGFIIDKSGYVVTNRHVIKDAYEIIVRLNDGAPLHAKVIGHGNDIDIALLKVDTSRKLQPVKFGKSDTLSLGDEVFVIGNPFGLGVTVTAGVISALNRDLGFSMFDSFIQTDAPINHGNSGGPIFNLKGQVIGVSTAYYTGGNAKGGSIGLGFAIPSETTQEIVGLLRKYGYLKMGWLGVDGATLSPEMINALGLSEKSGAIVAAVRADSPAARVLQPGDIITKINGFDVEDMRMLRREASESLGKSVRLRIVRGGKTETVSVTPAEWPGSRPETPAPRRPETDAAGMAMDLGFECAPIAADMGAQFNLDPSERGVIVTAIHSNSPASDSGLQVGDVLVSAQLQPVGKPADIKAAIQGAIRSNRDFVTVLVRSHDQFKYVTLPLKWQPPAEAALQKDNG